ncbi:hypothetical protein LEP1GSC133_4573 [Leptospira borgpetersenii serovar Pomona str. 200901868]|uniref:Uncharacterized protein n=1 Tax=Leptospira borgpetersenii serovar Pomona str. 200901868 TaxID=1192866 RepID=M6WEZ6_LEPBO|nr:hypothetical protein LEP1GSC133_4573 [Leptospira borgpetersenii serovar Pomona str. 200901868]
MFIIYENLIHKNSFLIHKSGFHHASIKTFACGFGFKTRKDETLFPDTTTLTINHRLTFFNFRNFRIFELRYGTLHEELASGTAFLLNIFLAGNERKKT